MSLFLHWSEVSLVRGHRILVTVDGVRKLARWRVVVDDEVIEEGWVWHWGVAWTIADHWSSMVAARLYAGDDLSRIARERREKVAATKRLNSPWRRLQRGVQDLLRRTRTS